MNAIIRVVSYFIWGIALPGWGIEWLVRRFKKDWRFSAYTATPYFAVIIGISTYLLIYENIFVKWVGFYLMTATQVLTTVVCFGIAMGKHNEFLEWFVVYGRRYKLRNPDTTFTPHGLYKAFMGYLFTIYYFGFVNYFVYITSAGFFKGVSLGAKFEQFFDFLYYSAVTIASLGYGGNIMPVKSFTKVMALVEVFSGLFFVLFIFGAFVSNFVSRICNECGGCSSAKEFVDGD